MEKSHLKTCPVCGKYEQHADKIAERLNQAGGAQEKAKYAQELLEAEKMLSFCPEYVAGESPECQAHRNIVGLRKKTAELILKAKSLAE